MRQYRPRRCSKRWLDEDCPDGVLAILDHPDSIDRYTIIYAEPNYNGREVWLDYLATSADLSFSGHGELLANQAADYRYRHKHRYTRWSDLPEAVKAAVRRDLS